MTQAGDTFVVAVDGGGTRCRIALSDGVDVHKVEVGSANVSTDFQAALGEMRGGLERLASDRNLNQSDLAEVPAYFGLAGITGDEMSKRLARELPFRHIRIADDRAAALRGALGDRDGFVAHCGTGSFLASQIGRAGRFIGGWGPVLGDQASAQWVGRKALSLVLDCVDDVAGKSDLAGLMLERFGGSAGIVRAAGEMSPFDFGALAPLVTKAAEQGDEVALAVLAEGARYLSDRLSRLGWRSGLPICLTGGIGPRYAGLLPEKMQMDLTKAEGDPLSGAIALAHAFEKEIENEHC